MRTLQDALCTAAATRRLFELGAVKLDADMQDQLALADEIERLRAALLHVLPLAEGEWACHEQLSNMGTTVGLEALRVIRAALTPNSGGEA